MKVKYLLTFLILWIFGFTTVQAQCDANNFSVTVTSGSCLANGTISVLLPGGAPCTGWQAILTNPSGVETIRNIPSDGGPIDFNSLATGDYSIRLVNGATVIPYPNNPVQVTTTYQAMLISSSSQAPSCPIGADQYTPDGTLEITIDNGGNGPFLYEATSQFGVQSFGPTANTSHTFANMEGGESVSFTVTDLGCGVSQTQDPVIALNNDIASEYLISGFRRRCAPECSTYDAVFFTNIFSQNRINTVQLPGNATISINGGAPQDLVLENANGSVISFEYPPGLNENDSYVLNFNDGCFTFSGNGTALPINDTLLQLNRDAIYDPVTCTFIHSVSPKGLTGVGEDVYNMFCSTNNLIIEQEITSGVWVNVPLVGGSSSDPLNSGIPFQLPGSGHYRVTASDDCHTIIEEFDTLPEVNPLDDIDIRNSSSVLEGTGALVIDRVPGTASSAPIPATTYEISPVPFVPSITISPSHPFSLAGSYTINFPATYTTSINRSYIGDLPPGDYEINVTDVCNNQAQILHTVSDVSQYNPSVQVVNGCLNSSSIIYDMNPINVASTFNTRVDVELWTDNGNGELGALVQGDIPPDHLSGFFDNISSGDYILRFTNINFRSSNLNENFSVVTLNNDDREYQTLVTVAPFQNIGVTTTGAFCDLNDSSSGMVFAEITSGTPTYPMVYELFDASNLSTPVQTFTETDISVTNHLFQNVSEGSYIVRISTACDGLDSDLDLILAPIQTLITSNNNGPLCSPGENIELSVNLPTSLFDIVWTDDQGNTVGTESSVTISVTTPTTYTASYSLKSVFCPSAQVNTNDIFIDFHPDLVQIGSESTTCNSSGADYRISVEVAGTPPYTVTGTGAPGIFNGNIWTSDPIPAGTDYNVSFEDASTCAILNVSDIAPNCCVFAVTCPTFPDMVVQCYADLPSAISLTETAFEALGNADGLIGDYPCGIIEITVTNSPDMGSCDQTITRTYTVTEYEDTNANGVRDTGENVILNTLDCQQAISVEDAMPPSFVESVPADITVLCTEIPEAATLTAIDNCSPDVQVNFTEQTIFSNTTDDFIIERLWEAVDSCGNVELFQQIINVTQPETEIVIIDVCVDDNNIDLLPYLPPSFDANGVFEVISGDGSLDGSLLDPSDFGVGEHQISYSSEQGICKYFVDFTIRINADCIPCNASEITASTAVTANLDGVNDFFEIKGGEYCNYTFGLQILNRWGRIVYESNDYRNDWSGFSPSNTFGSSITLPSGTYYYIISVIGLEMEPINGYIYLGAD
ncbi:gliding motility-associated C-terminal domain-containing protein [Flagellimonas sp. CMM7]|uniref:gliding motility-associated C-terminal domain-containing protein n=1 Tax=Flagellimonas sp. CMM7 TaxID=2654676 RepID=UPI0013D73D87|nr:gliding motility-associated C-terminal domain-containing protein [Flagellimonas sp. CMM7]UII78334.1 gliding motility-associated C-terminal domain-containing protein [Flagellimonas sp. CMM7]